MAMFRRCFALALLLLLAIAGAPRAASAETPTSWENGVVSPNGDAGMLYMAAKGGFGTAFGLDMQMTAIKADPLLLKALLSGQIDSYIGGPGSPLVAGSKGGDVRIVGCNWNKQSYALLAVASVRSLADLSGKTIGISTPGSAPDIFVRAAMTGAGVPPSSVNFVAAGAPSDLLKAMAAGVIDATGSPDEYIIRAKSMGLHVVTTSDEATPLSMQRCYFVGAQMVKQHPERVARFLAAEMQAYAYSLSHRAQTIALTRVVTKATPDAPEAVANYDSITARGVIDMSFEPPMEKLRWLRDVLTQTGQIPAGFDPAAMIDLGPLAEARKLVAAAGPLPTATIEANLAKAGVGPAELAAVPAAGH